MQKRSCSRNGLSRQIPVLVIHPRSRRKPNGIASTPLSMIFDESISRFQAAFENAPVGVALVSLEGRWLRVNQSVTDILGYTPDELYQTDFASITHPEDRETDLELTRQVIDGKLTHYRLEKRYLHKAGHVVWALLNVAIIRDAEQRPINFVAHIVDISRSKIAEAAQAALVLELERANRELRDFAHVVSHDLKAPLRGINTIAHWLLESYQPQFDEAGRELIDLMISRTRRMEALIKGVMEYSQVGYAQYLHIPTDLNEIVAEVRDLIVPQGRVRLTIETPLPTLIIDPVRIRQVFQNLIDNAVKYLDKPHGDISVGCMREGQHWHFYVTDNGMGIDSKHYQRIFEIFRTLKPPDKADSSGVGLSIVKRIVEYYGGKVWVESTVGVGSTFHFTLPSPMETNT